MAKIGWPHKNYENEFETNSFEEKLVKGNINIFLKGIGLKIKIEIFAH